MIEFVDFLREVRFADRPDWQGPYPWQARFAERAANVGATPPQWIVAPTGAGKTTVIDALVWALAMQAEASPAERSASTRMVWAIDRRILVDEVYEQSCELADRLDGALDDDSDPLHGMALRLLALAASGEDAAELDTETRQARGLRPLVVTRWRGGLTREPSLLSPFQPQVITSTVAQIGSRLLFRGYGVGAGSLAVSAALAGCDTTICLDEAHLANPFRETVAAIRARRHIERQRVALPDLQLITLTATPPADIAPDETLALEAEDHVRLDKRWIGTKRLQPREAKGSTDEQLAGAAEELLDDGHLVVACVANRVLTARLVHDRLRKGRGETADVLLLIGPQRPADRQGQLTDAVRATLFDGERPERPLVVVATQTIEVGLDVDFDAMVTQSASASALTQRLGRLNRSGEHAGVAIAIRDERSFYEADEEAAWAWLSERPRDADGTIDVSVRALSEDDERPSDRTPAKAATLTDAIVTQLAQTSERPAAFADPALEPLLRGPDDVLTTDVGIVWRCDLRIEDTGENGLAYREALLKLARPQPEEILTLSLPAARALIAARIAHGVPGRSLLDDADVEGGAREATAVEQIAVTGDAPFMVQRGRDILHGIARAADAVARAGGENAITLAGLQMGDTVILPTSLGGSDSWGLNHQSKTASDVYPDLSPPDGHRPVPIRLSLETVRERLRRIRSIRDGEASTSYAVPVWRAIVHVLREQDERGDDAVSGDEIVKRLERVSPAENSVVEAIATWLTTGDNSGNSDSMSEWAWRVRRVDPTTTRDRDPQNDEEDSEQYGGDSSFDDCLDDNAWVLVPVASSRSGRDEESARPAPPTLQAHVKAVRQRVRQYLVPLDLPVAEAQALELAALAHDLGKRDPRFQDFLSGGSANVDRPLLAKSTFGTDDPQAERLAREQSGLPRGFAHDAASATILHDALDGGHVPDDLSSADPTLATHVTGTHHGHGRPIWRLPAPGTVPALPFDVDLAGIRGTAAGDETNGWLDGAWLQQFTDLLDRYGAWTLAYLEGLVVLADRTVSREGG